MAGYAGIGVAEKKGYTEEHSDVNRNSCLSEVTGSSQNQKRRRKPEENR